MINKIFWLILRSETKLTYTEREQNGKDICFIILIISYFR